MKVVIAGAPPRTKKNHGVAVLRRSPHGKGQRCPYCKRPILQQVFPSAQWRAWLKDATVTVDGRELVGVSGALFLLTLDGRPVSKFQPIAEPVNARALVYRDANRGDFIGYAQGIADLLEKRGVVVNDVLIRSWDGSRLLVDRACPRVEVELSAVRPATSE